MVAALHVDVAALSHRQRLVRRLPADGGVRDDRCGVAIITLFAGLLSCPRRSNADWRIRA